MGLRYSGFSLIELLVVISIAAILLSFGTSFMSEVSDRFQANQAISQVQLLLAKARSAALLSNSKVSLCPLDQQLKCSSDWNQELTLFIDSNHNRQLDNDDFVLQQFPALTNHKAMRHFNNLAIGFDARGFAGYNNGSFSFCYKGQTTIGALFVISRNGRMRFSKSTSPDPLPKTSNGKSIPCPN